MVCCRDCANLRNEFMDNGEHYTVCIETERILTDIYSEHDCDLHKPIPPYKRESEE